ncbi:hypothetical protein JTE90_021378 [Oedothorax gibbosus]|uniref:Uncharacterized protein n=1 Tax=Oedothorax gibbosus TaxID=931172 RepID=A0AAV6VEI1_9ARAC|nr:hypothetical protein JTE90_021378 [Oedothorax gibbosus]
MICNRSCQALKKLTAEIEIVQSAEFTLSTQKSLLRRVLQMEDFLNTFQKTFSMPSFLCFIAHFSWCSGIWSIMITGVAFKMPVLLLYQKPVSIIPETCLIFYFVE